MPLDFDTTDYPAQFEALHPDEPLYLDLSENYICKDCGEWVDRGKFADHSNDPWPYCEACAIPF